MKVQCSSGCGRELEIKVQRVIGKYTMFERCETIHVLKDPEVICRECVERNKRNTEIS